MNGVKAALQASNIPRAIALAADGLRAGHENPLFLNLVAHGLQMQRRYGDALKLLDRAAQLAPNDPLILNAVGQLYSQLGRLPEAAKAFERALSIDPKLAPAHHGLGLVLEVMDDFDRATASFEAAVRTGPGFADPLGSLALSALRRKDEDEARAFAGRALRIDPHQPAANLALGTLDLQAGELDAAEARLRDLLDNGQLTPLHESSAARLLGDILDAQGRAPEAFAAYDRGNGIFRQVFGPQIEEGGLLPGVEFIARLKSDFAAVRDADWRAPPVRPVEGAPAGHVFMTGFFRSGTTLLEQILASHPQVRTMEEMPILDDVAWSYYKLPDGVARLATLSSEAAHGLREEYWRRVRELGTDISGDVFVDKLPLASMWTPFIAKVFPNAKILWARRDPRDVVLSCFRHRFIPGALRNDLADMDRCARLYAGVMDLFEDYRATLDIDVHVLRLEDLVGDFDGQTQAVCRFIGVPWREEMRDFSETAKRRVIRTPSARQVVRGLNAEGVGRWRPYAKAMAPALPILKPWVERYDYPLN